MLSVACERRSRRPRSLSRTAAHARVPVAGGRFGQTPPVWHLCPPRPTAGEPERRVGTPSFRVIVTAGLVLFYLAGCLAALSLLASIWRPSL